MNAAGTDSPVVIVPPSALVELAGAAINPLLSIVALRDRDQEEIRYYVADGRHARTDMTIEVIRDWRLIALREQMILPASERIVIQAEDIPIDADSVSWETQASWQQVRLVPDLYYILSKGYEDFEPSLPIWDERTPSIIWRGSTTGRFAQLLGDLDDVPRYRMCALALQLGGKADFGITDVVQTAHPQQTELISDRLRNEGHLREFIPLEQMARHRFIMDIDGNSNSWNFMKKLRLGCCVLRVESKWQQWFSDRLIPWTHYVPVASDLSDFLERVDWCLTHPAEASAIADQGRMFATDMKFSDEMSAAARLTFVSDDTQLAKDVR